MQNIQSYSFSSISQALPRPLPVRQNRIYFSADPLPREIKQSRSNGPWYQKPRQLLTQMLYPLLEAVKNKINEIQIRWAKYMGHSNVTLFDSQFLRLYYDLQRKWYFVDRPNADGIVVIVPTFEKNGKEYVVLLVTQRPPLGRKNIIEFPAGLIGDQEGIVEDIETAARRELLEETGLQVKKIIKTTVADSSASSPGIATEKGSIVYVNCDFNNRKTNLEADGDVIKRVVAVEKEQVKAWLEKKALQGFAVDASVFAALYAMPEKKPAGVFNEFVLYDADRNEPQ